MELLIVLGVFALTLLLIYQGRFYLQRIYRPEQKQVHQRLAALSTAGHRSEAVDILKKRTLSELPWLNELLLKASFIPRLERLQYDANSKRPIGFFLILSALLFLTGVVGAVIMRISAAAALVPSVLLGLSPILYLAHKRKKRMEKFARLLPDALDLVARALKAGHAFTGALRMVAEEFGDPVGTEFGKTVDQVNFGKAVPEALMDLTQRVLCEDLKFFAVSVIVQRETGGNLAEILEGLARLIRERFKFQGRVRVLSAEGRMSAMVLLSMPFVLVTVLFLFNHDYISVLFSDPIGTLLIGISLGLMSMGALVIKKIVAIKA